MRRLTIALTCVVLAGPLLAAGLGTVWISRQRQAARESLESLLDLRLRAAAIPIEKLLTSYRPRLENAIEEFFANSAQRETSQPLVATHFALDAGGRLIQPSEIEPLLSALLIEQPWLTDRSGEEPDIPNEPDPEEEPKAEPPPPELTRRSRNPRAVDGIVRWTWFAALLLAALGHGRSSRRRAPSRTLDGGYHCRTSRYPDDR